MSEYIGKRVIPRHDGVWDASKSYEPLCLVLAENGDSYISRRDVPAGVPLSNENYWSLCQQFSEQLKLMGDHMDRTVSGMKQANADTLAEAKKRADENIAAINKTASDTMVAVNQRSDAVVAAVNKKTDAVVADTQRVQKDVTARMEQIEARQEANVTASTVPNADYAAEVVDAREGVGGVRYSSLGAAIRSFSDLYTVRRRMQVKNANVVFTGKGEYTEAYYRDIKDREGIVRGALFGARILKDYDHSSIMTHCYISTADFRDYLLGKKLIIRLFSPIEGCVNFALGSENSAGGGAVDDPAGSAASSSSLGIRSISYNMTVVQGYNEIVLNLDETLPQVQALVKLIEDNSWGSVCLSMIPFRWNSVTFIPETGQSYEFYLAIEAEEETQDVEAQFSHAAAAVSQTAETASYANRAGIAEASRKAQNAVNAINAGYAVHAGIRVVGTDDPIYSTHADLVAKMDEATGSVSVTASNKTYLTTGQGISIRIGTVGELKGKQLILHRVEAEGYSFKTVAINFGAKYGNYSYFSISSAQKKIGENMWQIAFDPHMEAAQRKGTAFTDETYCWMMIYGNAAWPCVQLADGETVTNTYCIYLEEPDAIIYSKTLQEENRLLKEEVAELGETVGKLTEEKETLSKQVDTLTEQLSDVQKKTDALQPGVGNILWGKKWFATGDSFTSGGSVEDDKYFLDGPYKGKIKTYPLFIGIRNNMEVINDAISGSIIALDKTYVADKENVSINTRRPFSYQRYLAIPEDVDYITLWFGINDSSNTNLGTIDDTTNETFYGAWNVVMEWILTNRPWAKVGIIITNGGTEKYRKAEREIARKWGIPYLDMMGDDQTPVMTLGRESGMGLCTTAYNLRRSTFGVGHTPTGDSHPCWQAHEHESTFIEAFLRRL